MGSDQQGTQCDPETSSGTRSWQNVELDKLDERYGYLRIPQPRQERAVAESMRRFGQLVPLVVSARGDALAVVDGFKRLHAARQIGLGQLDVRELTLSDKAAVAAVYSLNRYGKGLMDLEEALVVRALCREHGLAQTEVAELLSRHKSWVSRRLMLVERLSEQVQQDVSVGLVSVSMAREIARLPRGNQPEVAAALHRHGLTCREGTLLVTLFEKVTDRKQQQEMLKRPREALERYRGRPSEPVYDQRLSHEANMLRRVVLKTMDSQTRLVRELRGGKYLRWQEAERSVLDQLLRQAMTSASQLREEIELFFDAMKDAP